MTSSAAETVTIEYQLRMTLVQIGMRELTLWRRVLDRYVGDLAVLGDNGGSLESGTT